MFTWNLFTVAQGGHTDKSGQNLKINITEYKQVVFRTKEQEV
jgi:hypothetical protein